MTRKLKEANRLKAYAEESGLNITATINRLNLMYLVTICIKGRPYSFPITLEELKGTEKERNERFARFIADSIINAVEVSKFKF